MNYSDSKYTITTREPNLNPLSITIVSLMENFSTAYIPHYLYDFYDTYD